MIAKKLKEDEWPMPETFEPPVKLRHCPWCHKPPALLESYPFHYRVHCLTEGCAVNPVGNTLDNMEEPCIEWNKMRA